MTILRISLPLLILFFTSPLSGQAIDNLEQKLAAFNAALSATNQPVVYLIPLAPSSVKKIGEDRWSINFDQNLMGPKPELLRPDPSAKLSLHQPTPARLDLYDNEHRIASVFTDNGGKIIKVEAQKTFIPYYDQGQIKKLVKLGFFRGRKAKGKKYYYYRPIYTFSYDDTGLINEVITQKEFYISPELLRKLPQTTTLTQKVVSRVQKSPGTMKVINKNYSTKNYKQGKETSNFTNIYTIKGNKLTSFTRNNSREVITFDDQCNKFLTEYENPKIIRTTKNVYNEHNHVTSTHLESKWKVGKQKGELKETYSSFAYDDRQNQVRKEVIDKVNGQQIRRRVTTATYDPSDDRAPVVFIKNTGKNDYRVRDYDQNDTLIYELKAGNYRKRDDTGTWSPWKKYVPIL